MGIERVLTGRDSEERQVWVVRDVMGWKRMGGSANPCVVAGCDGSFVEGTLVEIEASQTPSGRGCGCW